MNAAKEIIDRAFSEYRPALAYSGGGDSTVLLDLVTRMGHRPPMVYVDTQQEYNSSLPFAQEMASRYGLDLHVARAMETPQQVWQTSGFPMLGKMAARKWMQAHKDRDMGYRVDVSTCCRKVKIKPSRDLQKAMGCNATLTGMRGAQDDVLRGIRAHKDGAIRELKADRITQINPLIGWTDTMIERYTRQRDLPKNPMRAKGALTIGCMYCGGGAQFDNSGFRVLRQTAPENWRRMLLDFGYAPVIISMKYDIPKAEAEKALEAAGGTEHLMATCPWVFDFLRKKPLKGYTR